MAPVDAISIKNLTKYYQDLKAVDDISFTVKKGEFFGFLGQNGAGKTSTINSITGLADFKQGEIKVFGNDVVKDYKKSRKLIGLSTQDLVFDAFLTAEDILVYQGGYFGMPMREARERAEHLLHHFDIYGKRKAYFRALSGGMKRRLSIAKALMHQPPLLILDEPTAGLDVELRYSLWEDLKKLNKEGTTIFLTTHYIEEAERLCERVGIINEGKIIALDKTKTLMKKMSASNIRLTLSKKLNSLPQSIANLSYKPKLVDEKYIELDYYTGKKHIDNLIVNLKKHKLNVIDFDFHKSSLEEIFIKLTGVTNEPENGVPRTIKARSPEVHEHLG